MVKEPERQCSLRGVLFVVSGATILRHRTIKGSFTFTKIDVGDAIPVRKYVSIRQLFLHKNALHAESVLRHVIKAQGKYAEEILALMNLCLKS